MYCIDETENENENEKYFKKNFADLDFIDMVFQSPNSEDFRNFFSHYQQLILKYAVQTAANETCKIMKIQADYALDITANGIAVCLANSIFKAVSDWLDD